MRRLAPLLLAVGLVACTSLGDGAAPATSDAATAPAVDDEPGDATDDPTGDAPEDPSDPGPGGATGPATDCAEATTAMLATIEGQLDDVADRDWAAALDWTSDAFRADVDAGALERIILDGYPEVAADPVLALEGCVRDGDAAQLLVTLTPDDGTAPAELVYVVVRQDEGWRIEGAVRHGGGPGDDDVVSV